MNSVEDHPLWAEQCRLEERMASLGVERFIRETTEAYQRGEATAASGSGAKSIMRLAIEPTAKGIAEFIAAANSGTPGRKHSVVRLVGDMDPFILAYLTCRATLDNFVTQRPLVGAALVLGRMCEVEQRLATFEKDHKAFTKAILSDLNKRTAHAQHRRNVVSGYLKDRDGWVSWSAAECASVGTKLIEELCIATGVASIVLTRHNGKTTAHLQTTPVWKTWIVNIDAQAEVMFPQFHPCVIPPKDWTGLEGGGYHTDAFAYPLALVKTRFSDGSSRPPVGASTEPAADLSVVMRSVNAIQRTPWAIQKQTLEVLRTIIDHRLDLDVLPPLEDAEVPERPAWVPEVGELTPEQKVALKDWKVSARRVHSENNRNVSRRLQAIKVLGMATEYAAYPAIYFPHQCDFRGRIYTVPQYLTPQGPDFAKGLLVFAEGKPLVDDLAVGWFLIHGANTFGVDKVGMDERIAWTDEHHDDILAVAADALSHLWWTEADSPFCFLTWCYEYAAWFQGVLDHGNHYWGFVSCIPVAMDGTCNGLQHYSAMLRDPIGGAAVNLVPGDAPQDIYGEVAKVVMAKLQAVVEIDFTGDYVVAAFGREDEVRRAHLWLEFGIDRSITKRPVMVLPYGGTAASCSDYVGQAVNKQIEAGKPNPFGDDLRGAIIYLSGLVWESIGDVVVAARAGMGWLQEITRIASFDGLDLVWTAPSGFPVRQAYPEVKSRTVKTQLHGSTIRLNVQEAQDGTLDKRRQASGVAPNFVHSMDAAALVLTVDLALDYGVTSFAMIHDSYGALAADTELLATCIRRAFVDMYEDHDVLTEFRDSLVARLSPKAAKKVPSVPVAGGLDLQQVTASQFFFA